MSYRPTEYLRWAMRHYGRVAFDLASSGIPAVPLTELGVPASLEDPRAWDRLRAAVARYNGVDEAEVLPAMGTSHALWTAYAALLAPGDEALVEHPVYEPLVRAAEGQGARVAFFERDARTYRVDPDAVARAMTERTRVVALSNLHNPTGVRTSDEDLAAIARVVAARGAHLLVDEVYAPFDALCDERGVWGRTARRLAPNVVAVSSLTKCYGLGPHRIGWVLAPRDVIARGEDALLASMGHAPYPWMAFAVHAFERLAPVAARARGLLGDGRERVAAWVAARDDLAWSAPREGLFGFARLTRGAGDVLARVEAGIAREEVIVAPGAFFGAPDGVRVAWSIDPGRLDTGLARVGRVLG
jgi:aspartate/methionine/tyrosine aminotransferase